MTAKAEQFKDRGTQSKRWCDTRRGSHTMKMMRQRMAPKYSCWPLATSLERETIERRERRVTFSHIYFSQTGLFNPLLSFLPVPLGKGAVDECTLEDHRGQIELLVHL